MTKAKTDLESLADFLLEAAEAERAQTCDKYMDPYSAEGLTFGRQLYLRELDSEEADAFQASLHKEDLRVHGKDFGGKVERNCVNQRARYVVLVLANEKGQRIFTDEQAGAVGAKFGIKRAEDIYRKGLRLNEMDDEDAKKNSPTPNGSGMSSDSNSTSQTLDNSNGASPALSFTNG